MVAKLKKKIDGNWYCSNCMMGQARPQPNCFFCGAMFSNWEEVEIGKYEEENKVKFEDYPSTLE